MIFESLLATLFIIVTHGFLIVATHEYLSLLHMLAQEGAPIGQVYDATAAIPDYKPRLTKPHPQLTFLRGAPVMKCIEDLIDRGLYPQLVRARNMPTGVEWNNFDVVFRTFHATYCAKQGLSRTSDMAKLILQYLYHGMWSWATKDSKGNPVRRMKPIIFFFHRKMIGGRSRFAAKVEHMFRKFIKLYRANEKEWRPFLDDKGVGNPPMEFNVAVEEGIREYASDVHCMGTRALRSRSHWGSKVGRWRKREPFIALMRYLLGFSAGYAQWNNFLFTDYINRAKLSKTFLKRHLPLSDGKDEANFNGQLHFDWAKHAYKKPTRVKKEPNPEPKSPSATPAMIFDVGLGYMVPM